MSTQTKSEHIDVLIIGAGLSGIAAAHHLKEQCPNKSFTILESKEDFGGTWRTHTYPGVRSDSDLYTFGYRFKPWKGKPIAQGNMILDYMGEVIAEDGIDEHIRYSHKVISASWSDEDMVWTVEVEQSGQETVYLTASFLFMCQGYYDHAKGYTPKFLGLEDFEGKIVHPQHWPEDLDYKDNNVVVIGSGATAATLIPNMADDCANITMLQRSPTYFWTGENRNELADQLRALDVPEEWTHEIVRRSLLAEQKEVQYTAAAYPDAVKAELLKVVREHVGEDFDVDKHFSPNYRPWQQRLAYVPDGDLFKGIKSGKVSVVTEHIERFTKTGILLKTGEELKADIIVTATGFNLSVFGNIAFSVNGTTVDFGEKFTWRGIMLAGVPNMAAMFGYFRTSWTMRADLVSDFVCRLVNYMDEKDAIACVPSLRDEDANMSQNPWIDPEEFNPGYLQRSLHLLPNQGDHAPWVFTADYYTEKDELPAADLDDGSLIFQIST